MALQPNQRLGPYEILAAVGAGGMGEVYRARDTRLDRTVAIKVLPAHLADKPELRERFEREAKTIAGLNHPHICTLYDIGHQDGIDYLVLEYLEGETLAERLKKGPLPLNQVLQYAIEISDALDRAHRKGITHRDLKPGNVLLTKSGAKLLDFGLAKLKQEATPVAPLSQRPTAQSGMTAEGTILGTLQYMAPEQVEGKTNEIDARTDIFAFGAVVYEMVTGKKAFEGKTQASVMAKILEVDPPSIVSLQPMVPAQLDRVVKKCLAKEADRRWQTAVDLYDELTWIAESGPQAGAGVTARLYSPLRSAGWAAAGVFALITAVALWAPWRVSRPTTGSVARFSLEIAPAEMLGPVRSTLYSSRPTFTAMALSPDGNTLVFSGSSGSSTPSQAQLSKPTIDQYEATAIPRHTQLYRRALAQSEATAIPGTDGAAEPFFSPDGQWVAFFADGRLKKVPMNGGPAFRICDVPSPPGFGGSWGASWASTDDIVFSPPSSDVGMMRVPAGGGTPQVLLKPDLAKRSERYTTPQFLPGGKTLLFTVRTSDNWDEAQIVARRLDTGEQHTLIKGGADARYVPTGHLVYLQNAVLMAVPFDVQRAQLAGPPVAMLDGVMESVNMTGRYDETGMGQFAISASGNLVYASGDISPGIPSTLVRVDRKGAETKLNAPKGAYLSVRVSPDGQRLAVTKLADTRRTFDIWEIDANTGASTRLTFQGTDLWPLWSPDGRRILFLRSDPFGQVVSVAADGSGAVEPVLTGKTVTAPASLSGDGKWLAYIENPAGQFQIWTRPMSGPGEPTRFVESKFNLAYADFSPDGRWLAYTSDESGSYEVYVQAFPGPGEKHRISTAGGLASTWARNGHELFYLQRLASGKVAMMAVDFAPRSAFSASTPHALFEGRWGNTIPVRSYDTTPDAQHFVMLRFEDAPDQRVTKLNVVLNWFEELKQKVPTGKK